MTTASFPSLVTAAILLAATARAQSTERVSVDSAGAQAHSDTYEVSLSQDGRYVAFFGIPANLVPGDTNGTDDCFVHDRETGQTTRVSVSSNGGQGNGQSVYPAISADGRHVVFMSFANNLVPGDTNGTWDVFVHDRLTGQTSRVSVNSAGGQGNSSSGEDTYPSPSISGDGRYVAFFSDATNLVPSDINGRRDIFVHDRLTRQTRLVSVDSAGGQSDRMSTAPSISGDGRFVTYSSAATNLVVGDTNGVDDVFLYDRRTAQTTRVSLDSNGAQGNGRSQYPTISDDGDSIVFRSEASNLVPADANGVADVFVHDRPTGHIICVSVDSAGAQGNGMSGADSYIAWTSALSTDGRLVAFTSLATNLVPGDTNDAWDIFLHDRQTGQTTRESVTDAGGQSSGVPFAHSAPPSMSGDGRYVGFVSNADNLVPGDTNIRSDIFVRDRGGISLSKTGTCGGQVALAAERATPSGLVAFLYGPGGSYTQTSGRCAGLVLGISAPVVGATAVADVAGMITYQLYAPPSLCGVTVQAVDLSTCTASATLVLEPRVFTLAKSRGCSPFQTIVIDLLLRGAEPGSPIALLQGPAGSFVRSGNPCAGTTLGISNPVLITQMTADAFGNATYGFTLPPALCGLTVQAVERSGCLVSNTVVL